MQRIVLDGLKLHFFMFAFLPQGICLPRIPEWGGSSGENRGESGRIGGGTEVPGRIGENRGTPPPSSGENRGESGHGENRFENHKKMILEFTPQTDPRTRNPRYLKAFSEKLECFNAFCEKRKLLTKRQIMQSTGMHTSQHDATTTAERRRRRRR